MRAWIVTTCAALLLGAAFQPAHAAVPAIDWDPAYMWQTGGSPSNLPAGGILHIVGIVSQFGPPFADLDANDPSTEYTFLCTGLVSNGTTASGPPATTLYTTTYSGGTIQIYAGSPRNSSFAPNPPNAVVPALFVDGTLLLSGTFTSFVVYTNNFTTFNTGNAEGDFTWTGGTLYDRTFQGNTPCTGLFTGGLTWRPSQVVAGYLFRHDGKVDMQCPVPTRPSTWGKVKALYR